MRATPGSPIGQGFDLDEELWPEEPRDLHQRAGRGASGVQELIPDPAKVRQVGEVRHERGQLYEVPWTRTGSFKGGNQIPKHLGCLEREVAWTDNSAVGIESDLAGDHDQSPARKHGELAVARGRWEGRGLRN